MPSLQPASAASHRFPLHFPLILHSKPHPRQREPLLCCLISLGSTLSPNFCRFPSICQHQSQFLLFFLLHGPYFHHCRCRRRCLTPLRAAAAHIAHPFFTLCSHATLRQAISCLSPMLTLTPNFMLPPSLYIQPSHHFEAGRSHFLLSFPFRLFFPYLSFPFDLYSSLIFTLTCNVMLPVTVHPALTIPRCRHQAHFLLCCLIIFLLVFYFGCNILLMLTYFHAVPQFCKSSCHVTWKEI